MNTMAARPVLHEGVTPFSAIGTDAVADLDDAHADDKVDRLLPDM